MGEPLVSVATPVFNGADHIGECIESVLAQTYRNWRYVIIDNASTDSTPDIAQRYVALDSRIRHLRFEDFVDATANHNRAFDSVGDDSEFCKVVQADDWLFPECLERMVAAASGNPHIGIVGAYQLRGTSVDLSGLPHTTAVASGRDILRGSLLGHFNVTGPPTATMLRSSCMRARRPFWNEQFRHQDEEAVFWMLSNYDFAFVHQVLTFSRPQDGSRWEWSERMNSHDAENIVFLLRYGRAVVKGQAVLTEEEYRVRLRQRLREFVWWHARQVGRLSRLRDPEFLELHQLKRRQILAEANGDREVGVAMAAVGAMLKRGAVARGHRDPDAVPAADA
jgi:glycosyltransferase involved in cell wall biosynthesis